MGKRILWHNCNDDIGVSELGGDKVSMTLAT